MFRTKIRPVAFAEHPVADSGSVKTNVLDVILNFDGPLGSDYIPTIEEYCLAVIQKICSLPNDHLRDFLNYQLQLLFNPSLWLKSLDELIINNFELFESKLLLLKAEKTLFLIEFAQQELRTSLSGANRTFDFAEVKMNLKTITTFEEQLVYLYDIKAEYLQSNPKCLNANEIPFDRKIKIEIEKIRELQEEFALLKSKSTYKNHTLRDYIDNEDFVVMMKISKRTAQNWRDTGIIPYSQIASKIYYKITDVESLLASNYVRSMKS